jgi:hypothetical protein
MSFTFIQKRIVDKMDSLKEKLMLLILFVFGIVYSTYLAIYLENLYIGFIFSLITIGLTSTVYVLGKNISYKIIFYIWIAIMVIAVVILLFQWTTEFFESFRI